MNLRSLRSQIGLVSQEPVLFTGTIAENILFGWPEGTEEMVRTAAGAANAASFIEQLPDGYNTQVFALAITLDIVKTYSVPLKYSGCAEAVLRY